ncbi:hypothetical protein RND81_14G093400 [Saponaria officinalis]|uniref:Zinc finger, CCHC-type n=1 Tax=Saponaria officinalis TaxID=3572 RepID=A0AAW1GK42_SAPOF
MTNVKEMTMKVNKLEKFEGVDFRRWQKKMHFLLTDLKVVYVLSTPCPEEEDDDSTLEDLRKRSKWDNGDYICRGHILNGMSDSLFDIYQNVSSAKELWDQLESKYIDEDASSKKFLVGNFMNYKMSRPVMEQYNELLCILGQFAQHNMEMSESISVSSIIDKLPPQWKDFKHTLKHTKEDMSLVDLGKSLRIEESLKAQESEKTKDTGKTMAINMMNLVKVWIIIEFDRYVLSKCGLFIGFRYLCDDMFVLNIYNDTVNGHVHYRHMFLMSKYDFIPPFDMTAKKCNSYMLTKITRQPFLDETMNKFIVFMNKVVFQQSSLIKKVRTDRGGKFYDPVYFESCGIIHDVTTRPNLDRKRLLTVARQAEVTHPKIALQQACLTEEFSPEKKVHFVNMSSTFNPFKHYSLELINRPLNTGITHEVTALYGSEKNGITERKKQTLKDMVNSVLSYSDFK